MTKTELLFTAMQKFRSTLRRFADEDKSLCPLLDELEPLFREIEMNRVVPPAENRFLPPFQGDGVRYGFPHPLYSASGEFQAALEDWRSKPWWPPGQP